MIWYHALIHYSLNKNQYIFYLNHNYIVHTTQIESINQRQSAPRTKKTPQSRKRRADHRYSRSWRPGIRCRDAKTLTHWHNDHDTDCGGTATLCPPHSLDDVCPVPLIHSTRPPPLPHTPHRNCAAARRTQCTSSWTTITITAEL